MCWAPDFTCKTPQAQSYSQRELNYLGFKSFCSMTDCSSHCGIYTEGYVLSLFHQQCQMQCQYHNITHFYWNLIKFFPRVLGVVLRIFRASINSRHGWESSHQHTLNNGFQNTKCYVITRANHKNSILAHYTLKKKSLKYKTCM